MWLKTTTSFFTCLLLSVASLAAERLPDAFTHSGITENLGSQVSINVLLTNSKGNAYPFISLLPKDKITIVNFAYYTCPRLCHLVASGLVTAINALPSYLLDDIHILTISFDHRDTLETTAAFADSYKKKVAPSIADRLSWEFYYGKEMDVLRLASQLGFYYYFNPKSQQYAHPSVLIFLTPDQTISRYLYGISYSAFDFKLSVMEAKGNKVRSTVESMLLFCYNYDPDEKGYVMEAVKLMKFSGFLSVLFLGILLYRLKKHYS